MGGGLAPPPDAAFLAAVSALGGGGGAPPLEAFLVSATGTGGGVGDCTGVGGGSFAFGFAADGIPAINNLWDSGLICGTKVFMGGSGGASGATAGVLEDVFQNTKGLLGIHAEDQPTLDAAHAQW